MTPVIGHHDDYGHDNDADDDVCPSSRRGNAVFGDRRRRWRTDFFFFSFLFFRTVIPTRRILGGDFLFFLKSKKSDRSFKNLSSISSIENVRIFGFDNYIWYDVYVVIVV